MLLVLLALAGAVVTILMTASHTPPRTASPPAVPTAVHPALGIGDQKTPFLTDPRFLALKITHVRYDMPYDALIDPHQRTTLIRWMSTAHAEHLDVLVTIDHSRRIIYKKVSSHRITKEV